MAPRSRNRPTGVDEASLEFLTTLAHYLVAAGVTFPRLVALVRLAYFNAALGDARFRNKRVNQSAIAAMTGLTRLEVRKFSNLKTPDETRPKGRLESLVDAWMTDPKFATPVARPMKLRVAGSGRSFATLVKKYGGDIPPRAVLRELQRHNAVNVREGYVSLKQAVRKSREETQLTKVANALGELIKDPAVRSPTSVPMRSLSVECKYPTPSEKGKVLMHRRALDGLGAFISGLEVAGSAVSVGMPSSKRRNARSTRVRVVLVSEEI